MSYNPRVHAVGATPYRKARRGFVTGVGIKHSAITSKHGPVGVSPVDVASRVATLSGWRIPYFSGDKFEIYYELLCARNSTGRIKHLTKDRCIRVLSGQLFVTNEGIVDQVLMNQVCSFPQGNEYEFASSGDSDVEILVIQEKDYELDLEHITEASVNAKAVSPFVDVVPTVSRTSSEKAEIEAARLREERIVRERNKGRRIPVPKKVNEVLSAAIAPSGRPPLPGQQIVGVNPKPIGAAGFRDE